MATPDNSPHLKRVLHTYKNHAMNSLQGPGSQHIIENSKGLAETQISGLSPVYYGHKKKHYEEYVKKSEECKKCDKNSELLPVSSQQPVKYSLAETAWHSAHSLDASKGGFNPSKPPHNRKNEYEKFEKTNTERDETVVIVKNERNISEKEIDPSPVGSYGEENNSAPPKHIKPVSAPANSAFKWVEPQVFLAPPFPPKPFPHLASADPGTLPSHYRRYESLLDGHPIACFIIGDEPRLCLPQILNTVLRSFSLTQINSVCDELQIFCSRCTRTQLDYLKYTGVLPPTATSCGLITKTDAIRLTHSLLYFHPHQPPHKNLLLHYDTTKQVRVTHNNFGKTKGITCPDLYNSPSDRCILCLECNNLYSACQFVCHAHRGIENRTCHWGFDPVHWRIFLGLCKDQGMPLSKAEALLQDFKNKFDVNFKGNHKRKQGSSDSPDELVKKVRPDETLPGYLPGGVPGYDQPMLANCLAWGSIPGKPPAWAVVPLITKDGKHLPPPPAVFAQESIPSVLPSYLSQGPPILLDPGRVVPMSESENFERDFQPNVALAPPDVRDKIAREALHLQRIKNEQFQQSSPPTSHFQNYVDISASSVESRSKSTGSATDMVDKSIDRERVDLRTTSPMSPAGDPNRNIIYFKLENSLCKMENSPCPSPSPRTTPVTLGARVSRYAPDLALSTTDSDTESVSSVASKSEVVDEAEALLRGWPDKAASKKVLDLVSRLVKDNIYIEKRMRHHKKMMRKKSEDQEKSPSLSGATAANGVHKESLKEEELLERIKKLEIALQGCEVKTHSCKVKEEP